MLYWGESNLRSIRLGTSWPQIFTKQLILFLIFSLFTFISLPVQAAQKEKIFNKAEILATANSSQDGMARVLVGFKVPGLAKLNQASKAYKVITPRQAQLGRVNKAGFNCDRALSAGISQTASSVLSNLASTTYKLNRRYNYIPFVALSVTPQALSDLQADPKVSGIYLDRPVRLADPLNSNGVLINESGWRSNKEPSPSLPQLASSTSLIGANKAWANGYQGQGWYVAVLDTGIRKTHEFFQGKNIVEACFSNDGHCPNNQTIQYGPGSAAHHPSDHSGFDHGTHVAGIATGYASNRNRYGVAPKANLIAVQVFSRFSGSSYCGSFAKCVLSWTSDQVAGLDYIYSLRNTYPIASVNMSLGGGRYYSICDNSNQARATAIDRLRSVGIATIVSSGNNGYCTGIGAPACISSAISVGASSGNSTGANFSNFYLSLLNIFAPGVGITSSTGSSDTSYGSWNGTSMAAPHVSGAWALLRQRFNNDSVSSTLNRLQDYGDPLQSHCAGTNNKRPFIRVDKAIESAVPVPETLYPIATIKSYKPTFRWSAIAGATNYQIECYLGARLIYSHFCGSTYLTSSQELEYNTYSWRVRAYKNGVWSDFSPLRNFRIYDIVPCPYTIHPKGLIGSWTPTYSWSAVSKATNYNIECYLGSKRVYSYNSSVNYLTPSCRLAHTAYKWRVRAYKKGLWSGFSAFRSFRVSDTTPSPRTIQPSRIISDRTPTYRFSAVGDATLYNVQCYLGSRRVYAYNTKSTILTPSRRLRYANYRWRVRTYRSGIWSKFSAFRSFKIQRATPVPRTISPKNTISDRRPTYRWIAIKGATYYQVQCLLGTKRVYTFKTRSCSARPKKSLKSANYRWRVRAYKNGLWSNFSLFKNFKVVTPTPRPTTYYPKNLITDRTPTYRWSRVSGATRYQIQCYRNARRIYSYIIKTNSLSSKPKLGFADYRWRVRAYRNGLWSKFSNFRNFKVQRPTPIPRTANPRGTITDRTPTYKWTAVKGATLYQVQCFLGLKLIYSYKTRSSHLTPSKRLGFANYRWRVRAYKNRLWSNFSAYRNFEVSSYR